MAEEEQEYDFSSIERRWQEFWEREKTFRAEDGSDKPKYYALDMFPYPSGAGLHIGHPEGYVASDILARYRKACGFNVLHPMGWDAFGLPAEQYAIKTGTHPSETTQANVDNFRRQIKSIGFAIDWDREINTTDPCYYKWTQWIFLKLFQRGLAYVDEKPVWWCPQLKAVLANEEVVDGKSEVGNHPVERRNLRQVVLRITAYAEKLLAGLDELDWPDSTKRQQKAWIGRSEGAEVKFAIDGSNEKLEVYTTRPDTLFGATYMVVAPEHPLLEKLVVEQKKQEVKSYVEAAAKKSDLDRTDLAKDKSGVFTGSYCINPLNGEKIPVWVADYVLISYGTGAIMAVPGHDERDFEFAEKFDIPINRVIARADGDEEKSGLPYSGHGVMVNSGEYDGMEADACKAKIISDLEARNIGKGAVNYKLRDWIFSRQRYWGEPIPLVWVSTGDFEKAKGTEGAVKDLLPPNPVTTQKDGETLYALPCPIPNFRSDCLKLRTISLRVQGKVRSPPFPNGSRSGSIFPLVKRFPSHKTDLMAQIGYPPPAKPILCHNGQAPVGITCDTLIHRIPSIRSPLRRKPIGEDQTSTLGEPNTPYCTCSTPDSGIASFTMRAYSLTPNLTRNSFIKV